MRYTIGIGWLASVMLKLGPNGASAPYHSEESRRRQYDRDIWTAAMTPCARTRQRTLA
jgi:hypothetical protein